MKSLLLLLCSCFSCFLHCLGTCYSKPESNIKIIKILTPLNTAQSLFKPFLRNQLATKAQSFPQKSSNTMSAMIACHKQSARRFHMKSRLRFKFPTPWKTLIIKFPPPRGGQRCQIPRVWLGGVGGYWSFDLTDTMWSSDLTDTLSIKQCAKYCIHMSLIITQAIMEVRRTWNSWKNPSK